MKKRAKAARVSAWAVWVPRYKTYVPVTRCSYASIVYLYPSRRAARAAAMRGHSQAVYVTVVPKT